MEQMMQTFRDDRARLDRAVTALSLFIHDFCPDARLEVLTKMEKSAKTIPTTIEFVDIAGLVKDAHKGEGLGNKFLANIR